MNEMWEDIKGYEGIYKVSNLGKVKSIERIAVKKYRNNRKVNERILKPSKIKGYLYVKLYKNNKCKSISIHRLVAQAFISNPNNYKEVDHLDTNPQNNSYDNLRWCTHKSNFLENKRTLEKINIKPVNCYDLEWNFIQSYNSITEASKKLNLSWSSIKQCCDGKQNHKRVGEYRFRYIKEDLYEK